MAGWSALITKKSQRRSANPIHDLPRSEFEVGYQGRKVNDEDVPFGRDFLNLNDLTARKGGCGSSHPYLTVGDPDLNRNIVASAIPVTETWH